MKHHAWAALAGLFFVFGFFLNPVQAHIFNLSMKEISSLVANIKRLTALGLQVHITEMDVGLPLDANGALMAQASISSALARRSSLIAGVPKRAARLGWWSTLLSEEHHPIEVGK